MSCYDVTSLREFLDREVSGRKRWRIEMHLAACRKCRDRLEELSGLDALVESALSTLKDGASAYNADLPTAWLGLSEKLDGGKDFAFKGVISLESKRLKYIAAAAVAALLVASFSFAPVRTLASQFLEIFRVNKLETVDITFSDMQKIRNSLAGRGELDLESFGSIKATGSQEHRSVGLEEAGRVLDFDVKLPAGMEYQSLTLQTSMTVSITPKVDKVNDVLESLGGTAFLPDSLDGKEFQLKMPAGLIAEYPFGENGRVFVYQSRSPEITAPSDVDVESVRQALLQLPVIPDNIRTQLEAIKDWRHTMIIPNLEGSTEKVRVGNSEGVFMTSPVKDMPAEGREAPGYGALIWQQNGVVYGISGELTRERALEIAKTMI